MDGMRIGIKHQLDGSVFPQELVCMTDAFRKSGLKSKALYQAGKCGLALLCLCRRLRPVVPQGSNSDQVAKSMAGITDVDLYSMRQHRHHVLLNMTHLRT